jgi:hypothetical protein
MSKYGPLRKENLQIQLKKVFSIRFLPFCAQFICFNRDVYIAIELFSSLLHSAIAM